MFTCISWRNQTVEGEENLLDIQVRLCYILKHLEDRKALTPRSSIHSLKICMTSHPCNKYEEITLSYLLSVNYLICKETVWIVRHPCFLTIYAHSENSS